MGKYIGPGPKVPNVAFIMKYSNICKLVDGAKVNKKTHEILKTQKKRGYKLLLVFCPVQCLAFHDGEVRVFE